MDRVLEKFGNFDFGKLGIVGKNEELSIDFDIADLNEKLKTNLTDEEAVQKTCEMLQCWQEKVLKYNNYFVNYFLYQLLMESSNNTNPFWLGYEVDKKDDEEKYTDIFSEIVTDDFLKTLKPYLQVDTNLDMGEVFKQNFKFFDYDKFMHSIEIEYVCLTIDNELTIQLSDQNNSAFCSAYERFDENLNGKDWHNF